MNEVKQSNDANESCAKSSKVCASLYEECFPKIKIRPNQRKNLSPRITKGIKKSSKRKQKLYGKFLKKKETLLMKQPAKLIKVNLRQLSVSPKKTITHKRYSNSNMT